MEACKEVLVLLPCPSIFGNKEDYVSCRVLARISITTVTHIINIQNMAKGVLRVRSNIDRRCGRLPSLLNCCLHAVCYRPEWFDCGRAVHSSLCYSDMRVKVCHLDMCAGIPCRGCMLSEKVVVSQHMLELHAQALTTTHAC